MRTRRFRRYLSQVWIRFAFVPRDLHVRERESSRRTAAIAGCHEALSRCSTKLAAKAKVNVCQTHGARRTPLYICTRSKMNEHKLDYPRYAK